MKLYLNKNGNKRSIFGRLSRLLMVKDRRAVSAVISNMILIAAVIIVGFIALSYARTNSSDYADNYQRTVNSDICKLKESLSFEYAFYNGTSKNAIVYLLNSGDETVTLDKVYLSSPPQDMAFTMYYKNMQSAPSNALENGQEGYIVMNANLASGLYRVNIVTERGSSFVYDFAV